MKKKIKDITFFDLNEACLNHGCSECPLALEMEQFGHKWCITWLLNHTIVDEWPEILEREVEL